MKRRKVLAMLMTAVMTFTSVAPETALVALAGDDDAAEDVVVEELPFDFKGMPEDYVLDEEQLEMKNALKENDVLNQLAAMTEGVDYEADTMFCAAESEEEALTIAEAYNSELILYADGIAEFKLPENVTVAEALSVAQNTDYAMPVIEPNYYSYLEEPVSYQPEGYEMGEESGGEFIAAKTPVKTWQDYVVGKDGAKAILDKPDTFIKDPSSPFFQWYLDEIGVFNAWEKTMGKGVTVAVIDTGVYPSHEDLGGRVKQVKVGSINPTDYSHSHGTHVAGIIGATANNGAGVAGIAPEVNIISLNVFGKNETCTAADEARALNLCASNNVDIANMSLGGLGYSATCDKAMSDAVAAGVNVFVSMGNENNMAKTYPSQYKDAISVASTNPAGKKSNFSNTGKYCDIAAPGSDIMSCYNPTCNNSDLDPDTSGKYGLMSGTSMACPVAVGVAALYTSKYGKKSSADLIKTMQAAATKTSSKDIGKIVNLNGLLGSADGKAKAVQNPDLKSFSIEFEGVEGDAYAVYTTDGSEPAFLDGELVNGQVYTDSVELVPVEGATTVTVKTRVVVNGELGETETAVFDVEVSDTEEIVAAKAPAVNITDPSGRLDVKKNKVQLFNVNLPSTSVVDNTLTLNADTAVTWSSSNEKILTVSAKEGKTTTITALKSGSAKITAMTADKKKVTISVKVTVPVSRLDISADGIYGGQIALGKGKKLDVVIGDEYGKPSNKKLKFEYTVAKNATYTAAVQKEKAVKISSNGKVTINKKKWEKALGTKFEIGTSVPLYITATTTDGSEISDTVALVVHNCATTFTVVDVNTGKVGLKTVELLKEDNLPSEAWYNDGDNKYVASEYAYIACDAVNPYDVDVEVTSSNPDVIGVQSLGVVTDNNGDVIPFTLTIRRGFSVTRKTVCLYRVLLVAGNHETVKPGSSSKITVKLLDGSNKKVKFTAKLPKK